MDKENQPLENQNFKADKTLNRRQFINLFVKSTALVGLTGVGAISACAIREKTLINQTLATSPLIVAEEPTLIPPTETAVPTATQTATTTTTSTTTPKPTETMVPTSTVTFTPEKSKIISTGTPTPEKIENYKNTLEIAGIDFSNEVSPITIILPGQSETNKVTILKYNDPAKYQQFERFEKQILVYEDNNRVLIVSIHDGYKPGTPIALEAEGLRDSIEGNYLLPNGNEEEREKNLQKLIGQKMSIQQKDKTVIFTVKNAVRTNEKQTNDTDPGLQSNPLNAKIDKENGFVLLICSRPAKGESSANFFPGRYLFYLEASK